MRSSALVSLTLAAPLLVTGCMRQMTSTSIDSMASAVSVRFVVPQSHHAMTTTGLEDGSQGQLVVDATYDGFATANGSGTAMTTRPPGHHVVLWGGSFEGNDVTRHASALMPGSYMFAYFDPDQSSMIQGWLDVNEVGHDLVDVLRKWKADIPQQKRRLAYDLEINGRTRGQSEAGFENFAAQLQAIDRLERQIDDAIAAEMSATANRRRQTFDFLNSAEILILPSDEAVFRPTTRAAFSEQDLETLYNDGVLTKIVMVADYDDAQWKLRHVNRLYGDLGRYKAVLRQVVDRLERRKGLFLLTDHLHNHDQRFVENEKRLQQILGYMERMNEHMTELRDRRMALAFITELVAPDGSFRALDQEENDLRHERAVFEADRRRLDLLFDESNPNSAKRVAFERSRQRTIAAIKVIDGQLGDLAEARNALSTMTGSTDVIHRQGDKRLLTATFVGQDLPFRIREAVERESLMTVRLQAADSVFVPTRTSVTSANAAPEPTWAFGSHTGMQAQRAVSSPYTETTDARTTESFAIEAVQAGEPEPQWRSDMEEEDSMGVWAQKSTSATETTRHDSWMNEPSQSDDSTGSGAWTSHTSAEIRTEPVSHARQRSAVVTSDRHSTMTAEANAEENAGLWATEAKPSTKVDSSAGANGWNDADRTAGTQRAADPLDQASGVWAKESGSTKQTTSAPLVRSTPSASATTTMNWESDPSSRWTRKAVAAREGESVQQATRAPATEIGLAARMSNPAVVRDVAFTEAKEKDDREVCVGQATIAPNPDYMRESKPSPATRSARKVRMQKARPQRDDADTNRPQASGRDCPPLLRLLIPPCWFVSRDTISDGAAGAGTTTRRAERVSAYRPGTASRDVSRSDGSRGSAKDGARLARMRDEEAGSTRPAVRTSHDGWSKKTNNHRSGTVRDDSGCPLLLRILVPPCWLSNRDG